MLLLMQAKSQGKIAFFRHTRLIIKEKPKQNIATSSIARTDNLASPAHESTSETSATEPPRSSDSRDHSRECGAVGGALEPSGVVDGVGKPTSVEANSTTVPGGGAVRDPRLDAAGASSAADSRHPKRLRDRKQK